MTYQAKTRLIFWAFIATILIVAAMWARASDFPLTRDGWENPVTLTTFAKADSARILYGFPNLANIRDTVRLRPITDSTYLVGTGLTLDSIGTYLCQISVWPKGSATADVDTSYWYHEGPGRVTVPSPSGSYVCRVYGYLSDLSSAYVTNATVTARLEKNVVYDTCANMLVYAREAKTSPTGTNGYFYFDLIKSYCLKGEKYVITVSKPRMQDVTYRLTVPDSATYYMTWGN